MGEQVTVRVRPILTTIRGLVVLCLLVLCLLVLGLLVGVSTVSQASPSSHLVLHFTFDSDSTYVVDDSSSSSADGTLVNANPTSAFVLGASGEGQAVRLRASERQYVDVADADRLDIRRMTVSAWVRYSGTTTSDTKGRWEVLEKAGAYWLNVRTNGLVRAGGFFGGCDESRYWHYLDSSVGVQPRVWTHVAATYDGSRLVIFINGVRSGSMAVTGDLCKNDQPLAVGAKNAPAKGILEAYWDGRLDDIRVFNRALSADRIARLARQPG
jgi:hypothetical protein